MDGGFSVDDLLDPSWPGGDRSASEWELERFLHEGFPPSGPDPAPPLPGPTDGPDHCRALLESKLHMACAAAAKSLAVWSSGVKPEGGACCSSSSSVAAEDRGEAAQLLGPGGSQVMSASQQPNVERAASCVPALTAACRNQEVHVRQTTSGSSREDSDDDELEGNTGINDNLDPTDVKRTRRMQSNRESARRSRRRKQDQLNDLESQVGNLSEERSSLLSRFTDINQKCDEAAVDNRILKADIETLRAKVKMAEEQVKRVTGINPMILEKSNMPSMGSQFVREQVDAPSDFAVTMLPNSNPFFHQTIPNMNSSSHLHAINNLSGLGPHPSNERSDGRNIARALTSVQLTSGGENLVDKPLMQHVQKPFGPTANGDGTLTVCDPGTALSSANDSKK